MSRPSVRGSLVFTKTGVRLKPQDMYVICEDGLLQAVGEKIL